MKTTIINEYGNLCKPVTFDSLPEAVSRLFDKLDDIKRLLQQKGINEQSNQEELFIISEASEFLHLSLPTIYALVSNRKIPFMKKGKRLYFSKKALTEWLQKTGKEVIV
jgi:excisionase family DNA binding protein